MRLSKRLWRKGEKGGGVDELIRPPRFLFLNMNIEICRKCTEWVEIVAVAYPNDSVVHEKEAVISVCCPYLRQISDKRFYGDDCDRIMEVLEKHNARYICNYKNKEFPNVISHFTKEYDEIKSEMEKRQVSSKCIFYAEHLIGELNN